MKMMRLAVLAALVAAALAFAPAASATAGPDCETIASDIARDGYVVTFDELWQSGIDGGLNPSQINAIMRDVAVQCPRLTWIYNNWIKGIRPTPVYLPPDYDDGDRAMNEHPGHRGAAAPFAQLTPITLSKTRIFTWNRTSCGTSCQSR